MRFKKVERRAEMGVRVGGLPGDIPRVSGTSVVHYELIRNSLCGCAGDCVCLPAEERTRGRAREAPRVGSASVLLNPVCLWVCVCGGGRGFVCLRSRRQHLPGHYLWRSGLRRLRPPDAGSSIQTPEVTSTPTLPGLFARPWGAAVLRT